MRTAVITSASSGIGAACARRLAKQGWTTVLLARRRERLEIVAVETGGQVLVADVTTITNGGLARVSRCDLLINCAGGAIGIDPVAQASADDWSAMFDGNVLGVLRLTQLLLPRLVAAQGHVVNVTSKAALGGYEGGGGYCAAKSAARALTQSLRLELIGTPVRITEVLPGMVHTPSSHSTGSGAMRSGRRRSTPGSTGR